MVTTFVLGPCASVGLHVNAPVEESMLAPFGAPGSRLKVSTFAGKSGSVAVAIKVSSDVSSTVWLGKAPTTGGEFTSMTVIVKV